MLDGIMEGIMDGCAGDAYLTRLACLGDTTAEANEAAKAAKERRYEDYGRRYLQGKPLCLISASLRGPFDQASGWKNPWLPKPSPPHEARLKDLSRHDTSGSMECHLPSPQSHEDLRFSDTPSSPNSHFRIIQSWVHGVEHNVLESDNFWAPDRDGSAKKHLADPDWLKRRPTKRSKPNASQTTKTTSTPTPMPTARPRIEAKTKPRIPIKSANRSFEMTTPLSSPENCDANPEDTDFHDCADESFRYRARFAKPATLPASRIELPPVSIGAIPHDKTDSPNVADSGSSLGLLRNHGGLQSCSLAAANGEAKANADRLLNNITPNQCTSVLNIRHNTPQTVLEVKMPSSLDTEWMLDEGPTLIGEPMDTIECEDSIANLCSSTVRITAPVPRTVLDMKTASSANSNLDWVLNEDLAFTGKSMGTAEPNIVDPTGQELDNAGKTRSLLQHYAISATNLANGKPLQLEVSPPAQAAQCSQRKDVPVSSPTIRPSQQSPWTAVFDEQSSPNELSIRPFSTFDFFSSPSGSSTRKQASVRPRSNKRVSFAPEDNSQGNNQGSNQGNNQGITTRAASPPPSTLVDLEQDIFGGLYINHFDTMNRRLRHHDKPDLRYRQRLLPSPSQQKPDSPSVSAMADTFREADALRSGYVDGAAEHATMEADGVETGVEVADTKPQSPWQHNSQGIDHVAAVLNNLDEFLDVWDVNTEIDRHRTEGQGKISNKELSMLEGVDIW
ncbi:hypothetical protein F4808DRAFT_409280 [Astrocystis sublimbata]|nr:hypothetical protein F4808DRAFT_409280 [Astrocystis sublimbata]